MMGWTRNYFALTITWTGLNLWLQGATLLWKCTMKRKEFWKGDSMERELLFLGTVQEFSVLSLTRHVLFLYWFFVLNEQYKKKAPHVLFSGGWDSNVIIWDTREGKPEKSLYGPLICGDGIDNTDTYILTASYTNNN